jgi:hypothetical protein
MRSTRHALVIVLLMTAAVVVGCTRTVTPEPPMSRYEDRGAKQVPEFMKGTIFERVDLENTDPFPVSGYGLVHLPYGGGDNTAIPTSVRQYMLREMIKRGFGSKMRPEFERMRPEEMLRDPHFAVVQVDAYIPPGARKDDFIDVQVSALEGSATSMLTSGSLYRADLKVNGANTLAPAYSPTINVQAEGQIFVNPAYVLDPTLRGAKTSLRHGVVIGGGHVLEDRPLILRLRTPQRSTARAIEWRVEQRFMHLRQWQHEKFASAKDEGVVFLVVPPSFNGDWERFAGVVTHLYLDPSPAHLQMRAKQLADEAVKPDAYLQDISYCWEGIGHQALDYIRPLMTHESPDVAFAAARAAAFIGEPAAQAALLSMAQTSGHKYQIDAVQVLGQLPSSPVVNQYLRTLLNSEHSMVRIESYRVLAQNKDRAIYSRVINNKFILDIVPSNGTPIIYASRRGLPRIAIIGSKPSLDLPITFVTMEDRLTISAREGERNITIFYRDPNGARRGRRAADERELAQMISTRVLSRPDVAEMVARLGGEAAANEPALQFSYGDILAILQALSEQQKFSAEANGRRVAAAFVLQDIPRVDESLHNAPVIGDRPRPQGDAAGPISSVAPTVPGAQSPAAMSPAAVDAPQ